MTLAVLAPVLGAPSETFVRRHVDQLAPGRTVVVARRTATDATEPLPDVPVLLLDPLADSWGGPVEVQAVLSFFDEHGVSTVLGEFLDVWLPLVEPLRGSGRDVWVHGHGYDLSSRLREPWWVEQYAALASATGLLVPTALAAGRLAAIGLPAHVVPYGVDVPERPEARDPAGCTVAVVGRLVPKKAPHLTAAAFTQAAAARTDMRLEVVGEGPLEGAVRAASGEAVRLHGARPPGFVQALLRRADVFAQHSVVDPETGDEEGMPIAILEAMAAALPVVSTWHAGIPEEVVHGETGLLVQEGDVGAMAEGLGRLADVPELRKAMGLAGWERARERFDWADNRRRLRTLLQLES
ncbi:MAG: glycosyltransferase [Mycobacteriales bacterium]